MTLMKINIEKKIDCYLDVFHFIIFICSLIGTIFYGVKLDNLSNYWVPFFIFNVFFGYTFHYLFYRLMGVKK